MRSRGRRPLAAPANDNVAMGGELGPRASILREYLLLLLVLLGVGLFYWLSVQFTDWDRIQTCVTMGKRNCTPPIELNRQNPPPPRPGQSSAIADPAHA